MKQILSFFVLVCVSLGAMASNTSVLNTEGVEIWYDFDSSAKTASVTYKGKYNDSYDNEYTGEVVIPSKVTYEGEMYSVTSIGDEAFYYCYSLTSITLPESLTSIGVYAFAGCDALTSITLPDGLTSIGDYAFQGCYRLYEVYNKSDLTITAGSSDNGYVARYAKNVFTDSEGESKLKTVGDYLFYVDGEDIELIAYTGSETSITLPSDYEGKNYNIGDYAFSYCSSLAGIILPESLTSIGNSAFEGCYALTSITLPDSLTSMGEWTFSGCYALTSIILPKSLTSIGDYAFAYCYSLTSITLPDSLTSIGNSAFQGCYKLYEVYNKSNLTITAGSTDNGYVAYYAKNVYTDSEGESKLKTVGDYIFYVDGEDIELIAYTGSETSITLPSDYEGKNYNIGDYAFYDSNSLTSITLPEGVTSIGDYVFDDCSALTSITLPESLTSIGKYAFYFCDALTRITLPEGLTSIGDGAFNYCYRLYEVYNKSDLTITAGNSDNGYVAYYAKNVYSEGESKLKTVGDYIFYVDGEDIELIAYTGSETSITLPSDYEGKNYNIGDYAFYGCSSLAGITLPDGLTSIGDYAFQYCYALTSITLPDGLTSIGHVAFEGCYALTSITLPDGLTSIGVYAFAGCDALTSITLPDGLTSIYGTFEGCSSLASITLSDGLKSIGNSAFEGCSSLASITLPDGLTSIGERAFLCCSSLTSITSKNTTPPTVGSGSTFDYVNKSIPVYVPAESVEAYKSAEYWKEFMYIQPIDEIPSSIIDSTTGSITVRINNNKIVVEGTDNYIIYSVSGQNLGKTESVEKGIYIVVVNGKSYKVIANK